MTVTEPQLDEREGLTRRKPTVSLANDLLGFNGAGSRGIAHDLSKPRVKVKLHNCFHLRRISWFGKSVRHFADRILFDVELGGDK